MISNAADDDMLHRTWNVDTGLSGYGGLPQRKYRIQGRPPILVPLFYNRPERRMAMASQKPRPPATR